VLKVERPRLGRYLRWLAELSFRERLMLLRILYRTQGLFQPERYIRETFPAALAEPLPEAPCAMQEPS
jgi:hypothetical protein